MNRFLNNLERKLGRYAVPRLTSVLIGCFAAGYIISMISPKMLGLMTLDPAYILRGQIWRLITWVIIPPSSLSIWTVIMLFFYFSIGTSLERTWGDFRYNVFIFGGMLISVIAAFICYFILKAAGADVLFGQAFSTYYICMSIFLAYALTYPGMQVLLMFVIPIRVKWLGIIYAMFIAYDAFNYLRFYIATRQAPYLVMVIAILASFANFIIFFFMTRNYRRIDPREVKRRRDFRRAVNAGMGSSVQRPTQNAAARPRHRCAVCGRTELDDPDLTFRYCSKCAGNLEYCEDHLFTHQHVQ